MFLSIIVYSLTAFILYYLGRNIALGDTLYRNLYGQTKPFWSIEQMAIILTFVFISGARYCVGSDYLSYLLNYLSVQVNGWSIRSTFEPGFAFVTELMAKNNVHFSFFFSLWAFIQIFFVYYSLKDCKFLYPYIGTVLLLSPFFGTLMNGIRQATVACVFLYLTQFIKERKLFPYITGILICSLFHKSSMILIPLYFIFYRDYNLNRFVCITILVICTIVGNFYNFSIFSDIFSKIFNVLEYDSYSENIGSILEESRNLTFGPTRFLTLSVNIALIYLYPKIRIYFSDDKMLNLYFILFFIGACWSSLFVNSYLMIRLSLYFEIFTLVITVYTLYFLSKLENRNTFYIFSFLVYSYIYLSLLKVYISGAKFSVLYYKFFFLEDLNNLIL